MWFKVFFVGGDFMSRKVREDQRALRQQFEKSIFDRWQARLDQIKVESKIPKQDVDLLKKSGNEGKMWLPYDSLSSGELSTLRNNYGPDLWDKNFKSGYKAIFSIDADPMVINDSAGDVSGKSFVTDPSSGFAYKVTSVRFVSAERYRNYVDLAKGAFSESMLNGKEKDDLVLLEKRRMLYQRETGKHTVDNVIDDVSVDKSKSDDSSVPDRNTEDVDAVGVPAGEDAKDGIGVDSEAKVDKTGFEDDVKDEPDFDVESGSAVRDREVPDMVFEHDAVDFDDESLPA